MSQKKQKTYLKDGNVVARGGQARRLSDFLKEPIRPVYRYSTYMLIYVLRWLRRDPHSVVYIDPSSVTNTVNRLDHTLKRNDMWHFGTVVDGEWDIGGVPIIEYGSIFSILKQRLIEGKAYDDIKEFKDNLQLISDGEHVDVCATEEQYRRKWQHIEYLYRVIEKQGYRSQAELKSGRPFNEIRVQIGRSGCYLIEEGIHRLVIAQLLEIESIPVIITRRHFEYVANNK